MRDEPEEIAASPPEPARRRSRGGERLRQIRTARGLSQRDLAELVGISRQAVASIEADRSEPSLRVALALAAATGTSVEELFGASGSPPTIEAVPLVDLEPIGTRVALVGVAGQHVALPLRGDAAMRAGFAPASGVLHAAPTTVRPLGAGRPALVVAGCDPALPLLETGLSLLDPPSAFVWWPCGSVEALELVARGAVHVGGIHVRNAAGAEYNVGAVRARFGAGGARLYRFARWREGFVMRPEHAGRIDSVAAATRAGLRVALRERGAEARTLFERAAAHEGVDLETLPGAMTEVRGHLQVASAIAAHLADFGVASEPAAATYGLAFIPLADECYDLVVAEELAEAPEIHALIRVLRSSWLRAQVEAIEGYDAAEIGELVHLHAGA